MNLREVYGQNQLPLEPRLNKPIKVMIETYNSKVDAYLKVLSKCINDFRNVRPT